MKYTKEQILEASITIFEKLSTGMTDKEVMEDMGLTSEDYEQLKTSMFENKAEEIKKRPVEHVYVEYLINQSINIRDLSNMIEDFYKTRQYSAMVGAVRARAEIYDKTLVKGQEFGLIHKEPDRKEISAGVLVADLSNKQLKSMIMKELKMLNSMHKKYGEKDISELCEVETIYDGPRLLPEAKPIRRDVTSALKKPNKKQKAKMSRVHKGRRVKRPPPPIIND